MKKPLLFILILIFITGLVFCQNTEVVIQNELYTASSKNSNSNLFRTYYFHESVVDSSIFAGDSIVLYKNQINQENAKLELYKGSKFNLLYNIKLDTLTKINFGTGERIRVLVQNNDEIKGTYSIIQFADSADEPKDMYFRFGLPNGKTYDYTIHDNEDQYILIKK